MRLAEKMFSRSTRTCPIRSVCRTNADRRYFERLFAREWEVFVIRRDEEKGGFDWFTMCCEAEDGFTNAKRNIFSAHCG
jgi:hypothetical protein